MSEDERLLMLDSALYGGEWWTTRPDGTRKRIDPEAVRYRDGVFFVVEAGDE